MKLRYTQRAKLDLAEIHDYIAQENPQAARRVILLIRKAAETLPKNSQIGRVGRIAGTRELTVGRCPFMLAYRIESEEIQVLSVVHTTRLWPENL
ncbi:MAG: type II toxin-antitoxin system RelE/ParE family toxin [Candidatus Nitrotoga sp.]